MKCRIFLVNYIMQLEKRLQGVASQPSLLSIACIIKEPLLRSIAVVNHACRVSH